MRQIFFLLFFVSSTAVFPEIAGLHQTQAFNQLIYEIRDPQTGSERFRKALETIGEYLALNVLEELSSQEATIQTLTGGEATHRLIRETPVLVTILRGGLPINAGVHKVFPNAEVGFLAMSRNEETLKAKVDYIALPDLKDQIVILTDTMIATGGSLIDAIEILEPYEPKKIFVITAIAAEPGIARVLQYNPDIKILAAAIDPSLNDKGYTTPGLGDAGDRSYGRKHILELGVPIELIALDEE